MAILQQFDGPYGLHYFDPEDVVLLSGEYGQVHLSVGPDQQIGIDPRKYRRVWIRGAGEVQIWDTPEYLDRILR